tara:strand:- start:291 stop:467 length:177 start_codon:yes stop_codon:yes gene_type:complete
MYVSKKKALKIADLFNSIECLYLIKDDIEFSSYQNLMTKYTKELFDLGIPMVTLRGTK